eukprot:CAMPEP_0182834836 /NCGR_PEP_ID=MMETSP0006_2-20121128/21153_1 /TAXON_ID=97485 /ORGANISM="Prymnesium parvum, Strain Texoma1" /LENGTH=33 /DNA_ID= /DNA_START= /DNA_END= /DNA_ORIENTATION=
MSGSGVLSHRSVRSTERSVCLGIPAGAFQELSV